ncbi:hypothetical protein OROMI_030360 [Orobanche minor]
MSVRRLDMGGLRSSVLVGGQAVGALGCPDGLFGSRVSGGMELRRRLSSMFSGDLEIRRPDREFPMEINGSTFLGGHHLRIHGRAGRNCLPATS